jgi:hypothetical protein
MPHLQLQLQRARLPSEVLSPYGIPRPFATKRQLRGSKTTPDIATSSEAQEVRMLFEDIFWFLLFIASFVCL